MDRILVLQSLQQFKVCTAISKPGPRRNDSPRQSPSLEITPWPKLATPRHGGDVDYEMTPKVLPSSIKQNTPAIISSVEHPGDNIVQTSNLIPRKKVQNLPEINTSHPASFIYFLHQLAKELDIYRSTDYFSPNRDDSGDKTDDPQHELSCIYIGTTLVRVNSYHAMNPHSNIHPAPREGWTLHTKVQTNVSVRQGPLIYT